jgi:deoxyribodipyrimidine photolyase-related protein
MQARLAPRAGVKTLRFILGDHLTRDVAALRDIDRARDVVLMAEAGDETAYVPHHKQKIVLILSAMRHFAAELRAEGIEVDYVELEDPGNSGSFSGELARAARRHRPGRVVVTAPGEWRVAEMARGWAKALGVPVEVREDDRFYCSAARFRRWAEERKTYRMEFFYREMRRESGLLMKGGEPEGGRWNFDAENRKPLPKGRSPLAPPAFSPDAITRGVMELVARRFAHHFGDLESFGWAAARADALRALAHFIDHNLHSFGDYQDAMARGEPFLHHSVISPYLNIGLLTPREVCAAAERAYRDRAAPLNAVEGFIRQILGWREYIRGIYWLRMPEYAQTNALGAARPLPSFYWTGKTDMACVAEAVAQTRRHAYAHHIQRLMVTGNFALLAGVAPREVEAWYLAVYADAFEWVELPNTHGMALFADGGLLASKPYAASGAYIDKMSDYCAGCRFDPKAKSGERACPFNYLYWKFLIENRAALSGNPRLAMPYRTLERMDEGRRHEIEADSRVFLAEMGNRGAG